VQNYINELPKHKNETFEVTIKLDGSSMTVFHINDRSDHFDYAWKDIETRQLRKMGALKKLVYKIGKMFGYNKAPEYLDGLCSRNIQLDPNHSNHFSNFVKKEGILENLRKLNMNVAVQGELIGPSIQENYEKVEDFQFYVYDVFDIDAQKYMRPSMARAIAFELGLEYVPVLDQAMDLSNQFGEMTPETMRDVVQKILDYAEGPGMNQGVKREGVVFKSNSDGSYPSEFSFKAISNSYLLKKG
jgi:RNA ligase (TIGR02306 family)